MLSDLLFLGHQFLLAVKPLQLLGNLIFLCNDLLPLYGQLSLLLVKHLFLLLELIKPGGKHTAPRSNIRFGLNSTLNRGLLRRIFLPAPLLGNVMHRLINILLELLGLITAPGVNHICLLAILVAKLIALPHANPLVSLRLFKAACRTLDINNIIVGVVRYREVSTVLFVVDRIRVVVGGLHWLFQVGRKRHYLDFWVL